MWHCFLQLVHIMKKNNSHTSMQAYLHLYYLITLNFLRICVYPGIMIKKNMEKTISNNLNEKLIFLIWQSYTDLINFNKYRIIKNTKIVYL